MRVVQIVIALSLVLGVNYYVFYRLWNLLPIGFIYRSLLIVFAVIVLISPFVNLLLGEKLPFSVAYYTNAVSSSWFIIFIYLLIIFLLFDLIRVLHILPVERFMYHSWVGLISLGVFVTAVMSLGYINYLNKERVELSVDIRKSGMNESSLKIVAVSDLHLGFSIGEKELRQWIDLINRENPDIVLFAGDVIDNNTHSLFKQNLAPLFKQIHSPYGMYAVMGNHEYISGASGSSRFFSEAGITLLKDSTVLIDDRFYVVGRDDRTNDKRKTIEELVISMDRSKPTILLDHQPYNLEEAEKNNIDLQLSGHTHRGQIWPLSWITDLLFEKSHGYLKKGNTHIYVSSGLGIWGGKFRIGTSSEYVIVNLKLQQ